MRNASNEYIKTMHERTDFYPTAEITFAGGTRKTIGREDFTLSGNSIIDSAGVSSFPLGMLVSKYINITLMNDDDRLSDYDFYGAKIFLQTNYDLDSGVTDTLNIGIFTVITPESYGETVQITAMDDGYKTDIDYSTGLTYPVTVGVALRDSCQTCGITLLTGTFANDDYIIPSAPEGITHRQFIGMCAMIAGGNARFDEYNRLQIMTYDFSYFEKPGLDGGQFDYSMPYATGDNADGGSFNPWNAGYTEDGGAFGDRNSIHVLYEFKDGMTIGVDDVVITGVQFTSTDEEGNIANHLYGTEGYVLSLENQLVVGKEDEAAQLIGEKIVGLRFRPFTSGHIAYPLAEFGDLAYIIDRKNNVYQTVITDVDFQYYGFTTLKCSADSPLRNSRKYNGEATKAIVEARKMVQEEKTEREQAVENLAKELAQSSGLFMTEEQQPDKSIIYYMHDKPTLAESKIVWKLTANALGISTDGGKTYPYGLDVTGVAILNRIYAIGIDANYIKSDSLSAISANLGTVTAGILQSANYAYTSGNFATAGFLLDLASGLIRSKQFSVDASGNAFFSGSLNAAGGTFKGELQAAGGTFTGNLSAAKGSFLGDITGATGKFAGKIVANSIDIGTSEDPEIADCGIHGSAQKLEIKTYDNASGRKATLTFDGNKITINATNGVEILTGAASFTVNGKVIG